MHKQLLFALSYSLVIVGCSKNQLTLNSTYNPEYKISEQHLVSTSAEASIYNVDESAPAYEIDLTGSDFEVVLQQEKASVSVSPKFRTDGNGYPILVLFQPFSESWENTVQAIEQSKLELADQDRTAGLLTLKAIDSQVTKGRKVNRLKSVFQIAMTKTPVGVELSVQFSSDSLPEVEDCQLILDELLPYLSY